MRFGLRLLVVGVLAACVLFGQRKEYMELQREVAILEDQVRALQKSLEEKLELLSQEARQAADAARSTNASVAGLEQRLGEQSKTLSVPVASIGAKVDEMSGEFQSVRESVASLNARMARLEQQLTDISTALKTLQSPPAPPAATPAISAETLFQNALRDRDGGNLALALKEFTEYVQVYGSTDQAASAQYYIGDIYYRNEQFDDAVLAFDQVLANYLDSDRAPDAHYMKGMALLKLGEAAKARSEFNTLIKRFPGHELAAKARNQLKTIPAAPAKPRTTKAK
jgi:tol-pal system protein YbgF